MVISAKLVLGYCARKSNGTRAMVNITLHEQNDLWSRSGRSPDVLVCAGEESSQYTNMPWLYELHVKSSFSAKRAADGILASLFYIELIELPQLSEMGFLCRILVRCRVQPAS
jgi:hypothetical protein